MSYNDKTIYNDAPAEHVIKTSIGSADWDWLRDKIDELEEQHPNPDCVDYRIEVFDYDIEVPIEGHNQTI